MASLFLSAAHKSSGKTTLSIGLCAALSQRGLSVQPFKKGPDYIDPIWLGLAAGKPCYNLDYFVAGERETIDDFHWRSRGADISLIEGNKGLHDGLDLDGSNSNAALAKAVDSPVILVVDARGTMRGIAPLLIGYQMFDREVNIAGVIANMTGGKRHESKLRAAVEHYTDIPFLGAVQKQPKLELSERHLGLIPGYEDTGAQIKITQIAEAVSDHIDLDRVIEIGAGAGSYIAVSEPMTRKREFAGLRVGIVQDRAFGFYYPGDLQAMRESGAELVKIDALHDTRLPEIDGLIIGGGFPERHAAELEANLDMRNAIKNAIDAGLPTYAECGGLMYLSRQVYWNDQCHQMVGVIPAETTMHDRPQGRGYVKLAESNHHPWPLSQLGEQPLHAHEFHFSSLDGLPADFDFAYRMTRGYGISGIDDGLVYRNLLASYSHLRNTARTPWVRRFLKFVQNCKSPHRSEDQVSAL